MPRIKVYLVCGGRWHDFDFARLELLKLLAEDTDVRVRVAEDYRDTEAIAASDVLVTYTCDLRPTEQQQAVLHGFVAGGKRWLALHGTNSVFEFRKDGVASPRVLPLLMQTLGSQFVAHPPIAPYRVTVSDPTHPLVAGVEPFDADDELYLSEYHGEIHPLLETRFTGEATGFIERDWLDDAPRLVMYLHPVGAGAVLYYTLGHCRSAHDMQPMIERYPRTERGAWSLPVHYELLRRSIAWAKGAVMRDT